MMKNFSSYAEYESWTATFENASDYEEIPVAIDDGWKISIDISTACCSKKRQRPTRTTRGRESSNTNMRRARQPTRASSRGRRPLLTST